MYYAGIGSRQTPPDVLAHMQHLFPTHLLQLPQEA